MQLPRCRRELVAEQTRRLRDVDALQAQLELERDRPPVVVEVPAPAPSTWSSTVVWIVGGVALVVGLAGGEPPKDPPRRRTRSAAALAFALMLGACIHPGVVRPDDLDLACDSALHGLREAGARFDEATGELVRRACLAGSWHALAAAGVRVETVREGCPR